jgi:H+/Cl- antiporter ClcA
MSILPSKQSAPDWKMRVYVVGVLAGAVFGIFTSYLYARAAEEDHKGDKAEPRPPSTGELLTLGLALLGLVRQISELGKPPQKKR